VTALLELEDLRAGYGSSAVVRDLSLHVDEGEVVALLGSNGAGKTTTLLTASAQLRPLGGRVNVFGRPIGKRRPHDLARDGLVLVPEDRALFFSLTVQENLRLATRNAPDISPALEYFPALEKLMDRKAGLLSGGEQQMLAVGRALVMRPRLLLIDEMSLGLAPVIVQSLLPIIPRIAADTGCGLLLVEQHVQIALEVARRAYVLAHGELVLEGAADQLRRDRALLESSYLGERAVSA
jgi:branched-chain amino acid transport system ATP-binding protein